jgi:glycolate oxidase
MSNITQFLKKLALVLDEKSVVTEKDRLQSHVADNRSMVRAGIPLAIVYPKKVEDVQAIVRAAASAGITLVPCSSERGPRINGGSLPSVNTEAVIVDLSRMKKIIRVDVRNRIALVEAGVTFAELNAAAAQHGLRIEHPLQAKSGKSIVASLLDREPTLIPKNQWDVADPLLCMEIVLGNGAVFRTGSAAGPGTLEEQWASGVSQSNPMGPGFIDIGRVITGSQGTLSIVIWASVKLQYIPSIQKLLFIQADRVQKIEPFVYQGIRQRFGDEYVLLDSYALASMLRTSKKSIADLARSLPKWTLIFTVAGYNYFPEFRMKNQESDLRDIAARYRLEVKGQVDGIPNETILDLLNAPSEDTLWKHRTSRNCVDVFFLSTLDKAQVFLDIMNATLKKWGFSTETMGVYLQPTMQGRNCHVEFVVPYDDYEKALVLYRDVIDRLMQQGAYFNRPYGPVAESVFAKSPAHIVSLNKMKELLDPARIYNRGKLCY